MSDLVAAAEYSEDRVVVPTVRVVIVDDTADVRLLLRMMFDRDPRFDVVGEAGDGAEAIELARRTQPDLLILDRQMPVLGGIEALPQIRERAPNTAVVVYTAKADSGTHQAALAAGALDVLEKSAGGSFVERLADVLLGHWATVDAVDVRIGPVPSAAALVWIDNSTRIVEAVRDHLDELELAIDGEVLDAFLRFLSTWRAVAATSSEFVWVASAAPEDVTRLVETWAEIDRLPVETLHRLGCDWSPTQGQPFFRALTSGVLRAMEAHRATQQLAIALAPQWRESA